MLASLGLVFVLALVGARAEAVDEVGSAVSDSLSATAFELADDEALVLTSTQRRVLVSLGVVAGLVALAFLAAWVVTRLGDRPPGGGPAPLVDVSPGRPPQPD